jgi:hypothetical protein
VLKSNLETCAEGVMVIMGKSIPSEIKNTSRVKGKIVGEKEMQQLAGSGNLSD